MNDLTFYKESLVLLLLAAALLLHIAAAVFGFVTKREKLARALNTGITVLNIALHLFLILVMMYKSISLDEAVLVMMISLFLHTLIYYIYYAGVNAGKKKAEKADTASEAEAEPETTEASETSDEEEITAENAQDEPDSAPVAEEEEVTVLDV